MAKKSTRLESKGYELDDSLDIPNFNFDFDEPKKNDNPILSTLKAIGKGAVGSVFNQGIIRSTIKNSLPTAYGTAYDFYDLSRQSARELYANTVRELKPANSQLKQITKRFLPKTEDILPEKIGAFLKEWSTEQGRISNPTPESVRSDTVAIQLGSIFKAQAEDMDRRAQADDKRQQLTQGLEQIRHRDLLGGLQDIDTNVAKLAQYQDNVLANYQKKSLELQFRQYYATADILQETRKSAAVQQMQLEALVRNTGLPDFAKLSTPKMLEQMVKNRFLEKAQSALFGGSGGSADFIKKYIENIKKTAGEKLQATTSALGQTVDMADMASQMAEMAGNLGPSKKEMAGGFLGSLAGDYGVGKAQKWLGKKLAVNPAIQKGAEQLQYTLNNPNQVVGNYLTNSDINWGKRGTLSGLAGNTLKDFLADALPSTQPQTALELTGLNAQNQPAVYSNAAQKSIIEVIPGLLARIQRELVVTRTGENFSLLTYDYKSNKFTTEKAQGASILQSFASDENKKKLDERLEKILETLDPSKKLGDAARGSVKDRLTDVSLKKSSSDASVLARSSTWNDSEDPEGIAAIFQSHLGADASGKRNSSLQAIANQRKLSDQITELTKYFNDPRAQTQELAKLGQMDSLAQSGLFDRSTNSLNLSRLGKALRGQDPRSAYSDETYTGGGGGGGTPPPPIAPTAAPEPTPRPVAGLLEPSVKLDAAQVVKAIEDQSALIQKLDHTDLFQKMVSELVGINTHLEKGINTYSLAEDYLGSGARAKLRDRFGRVRNKVSDAASRASEKVKGAFNWRELNLGTLADATSDAAKGIASKGLQTLRSASSLIGGMAGPALAKVKDVVVDTTQKAADYFGDVYVKGESVPRLTRGQMRAKLYFDKASGKVLTSLKDLQGGVVDKDGNILLGDDELKDAVVRGNRLTSLKEALSSAGGSLKGLGAMAVASLGTFYGGALTLGIGALKAAVKLLPPYDVYIAGEKEPVLYAHRFKLGDQYFSKKTGKSLIHPRDIDGPVIDKDGNYLVTEEDFQKGLVDKNGLTVTSKVARLVGKVKGLAQGALGVLKGVLGGAKEFFVGMGQALKDVFGGIFGLRGEYLETSKKQLDVQTAILELLKERLTGPKKHVLGDEDGDGIREGSAEDIREKESKAKKEELNNPKDGQPGDNVKPGRGVLSRLAGLLGKKKDSEKLAPETGGVLSTAGDLALNAAGGAAGTAAAGVAGKAAGVVGGAGKSLLGGLGRVGLGMLAGSGALLSGASTVGGLALSGAGAAAGSIGSGLLAVGGGLATAAGAIASVITAPVLLGALGVAALGAGAYYGYKYLTRATLDTLSTVRYAQYGFPSSDKDHLQAVFDLEDKLLPNVKIDGDKAYLSNDKLDMEDLTKPFNVKVSGDSMKTWATWFTERFKPVFLAHQAVVRSIKPGLKVADVDDKLTPQEKLNYLEASSMPSGPFDQLASPFPDLNNLTIAFDGVKSAIEVARAIINKEIKNDNPSGKAAATVLASTAAVTGGANTVTAGANSAMGGSSTASDLSAEKQLALAGLGGIVPTMQTNSTEGGVSMSVSNSVPADFIYTGQEGRLDALTSIRYKTYGLVEMDVAKIRSLRYLEVYVGKSVTFTNAGATFDGDVEALLDKVKGLFGVSGPRSPRGLDWMLWFRNRFLPVFLNYATMVAKLTGKKAISVMGEMELTPQQQMDTANAVYTTSAVVDGSRISVWKVSQSPWLDYPLNGDDATVQQNLQFLTETIKAVKLNEQMSAKVQQQQADDQRKGAPASAAAGGAPAPPSGAAGAPQSTPKARVGTGSDGLTQSATLTPDGKGTRAVGDFTGGTVVQHPGKGTGGDINSIPLPTGPKGWDAMKDMFIAVSKATGVDLKVLASTSAIESGFDANAMPPVNPQTGQRASGAIGLFQFIPSTWNMMLNKYGAKYGIAPGTPASDPRANALMGAEFVKENLAYLQSHLKKDVTTTDIYMAHFLGAGGANKFLSSDPTAIAADVMPKEAAANFNIFHDKSRNNAPRTFGEIYSLFRQKVDVESKKYNIDTNSATTVAKADAAGGVTGDTTTATAPSNNPAQQSGTTGAATAPDAMGPPKDLAGPAPDASVASSPTPADASTTNAATGAQTLVNSSTSAGTAAGASSGSGYGSSIDAQQSPEATPDASVIPAAYDPNATPVVRSAPNYAGFNATLAPTPAELAAQRSQVQASMGGDVKSIAQTLLSSLQVQTDSLTALRAMANLLSRSNPTPIATAAANDATTAPAPARAAQTAPVSMERNW